MMLFQIETINDYIEFERSLAGQDDELDDDAWAKFAKNVSYKIDLWLKIN